MALPICAAVCEPLIERENREFFTDLNNANEFPMHGAVNYYCPRQCSQRPNKSSIALRSQPHCTPMLMATVRVVHGERLPLPDAMDGVRDRCV